MRIILALGVALCLAGSAMAAELTDQQMDQVTAGWSSAAVAEAFAQAMGGGLNATTAVTHTISARGFSLSDAFSSSTVVGH